jgi:hypothetical protein
VQGIGQIQGFLLPRTTPHEKRRTYIIILKNGVFWDVTPCGSTDAWDLALYSGYLQTHATTCYPPTPLCISNSEFHSSFLSHMVFLRSVRRLLVTVSVIPSSPILVTLLKEALSSSETSVLNRATWRNIPEDTILHSHRRENLKSFIIILIWIRSRYLGEDWCLLGCYAVWLL